MYVGQCTVVQIDAAKDQARKEVEEARRRGREQLEDERSGRQRAETMYQDALKDSTKYDQDRRAVSEPNNLLDGWQFGDVNTMESSPHVA